MTPHRETLLTRREALVRTAAATLAATGLGTPGVVFAATYTKTPGLVLGPYFLELNLNRSDVRTNSSTGAVQQGLQMNLLVNVCRLVGTQVVPVSGAKVDIWQANALGVYSGFTGEGTAGQNFLRGYQNSTAKGVTKFVTVYPGWYQGRTQHIHARVRLFSGATTTYDLVTQLFLNDAITDRVYQTVAPYNTRAARTTRNTNDGIYGGPSTGTGGTVSDDAGEYTLLRLANNNSKATASITVVI